MLTIKFIIIYCYKFEITYIHVKIETHYKNYLLVINLCVHKKCTCKCLRFYNVFNTKNSRRTRFRYIPTAIYTIRSVSYGIGQCGAKYSTGTQCRRDRDTIGFGLVWFFLPKLNGRFLKDYRIIL